LNIWSKVEDCSDQSLLGVRQIHMEYVCKGGLVRFFLLFFNDFRHMYVEFVDENFFTRL
jgi:hypothetical protein